MSLDLMEVMARLEMEASGSLKWALSFCFTMLASRCQAKYGIMEIEYKASPHSILPNVQFYNFSSHLPL